MPAPFLYESRKSRISAETQKMNFKQGKIKGKINFKKGVDTRRWL